MRSDAVSAHLLDLASALLEIESGWRLSFVEYGQMLREYLIALAHHHSRMDVAFSSSTFSRPE